MEEENKKVYLLSEEQMQSITTRLSALGRSLDAEKSKPLTLVLDELSRLEHIKGDEYFTKMIDKILAAMGKKGGAGWGSHR